MNNEIHVKPYNMQGKLSCVGAVAAIFVGMVMLFELKSSFFNNNFRMESLLFLGGYLYAWFVLYCMKLTSEIEITFTEREIHYSGKKTELVFEREELSHVCCIRSFRDIRFFFSSHELNDFEKNSISKNLNIPWKSWKMINQPKEGEPIIIIFETQYENNKWKDFFDYIQEEYGVLP